jgi:divalent metal cation (Fe/Co/Zn/Cd) transporter
MATVSSDRVEVVRRGVLLSYLTIGYNCAEAVIALAAGVISGSVALTSFGADSVIEVTAGGAALWRLRVDHAHADRERAEGMAHRIIGWCFLALALYVVLESGHSLWGREHPDRSVLGLLLLVASVIVMPLLARAKRRVAEQMGSSSLRAEATQTALCAYLSLIALAGVGLNAAFGWWWADPVAALCMVPIIVSEGLEGIRGDVCADGCAH